MKKIKIYLITFYILIHPSFLIAEISCSRVISLAPSITEIFHSLSLLDSIVGVSDFDKYPPEVKNIQKIGGLFQISIEQVLMLNPSLVVGFSEHGEILSNLEKQKIKTLTIDHRKIAGILDSIGSIGNLCEKRKEAEELLDSLNNSIKKVKDGINTKNKPSVLIVIDRDISTKKLSSLYASGTDGFYNELIETAGGKNIITSKTISLPTFSLEGILAMNPDVIIEIQSSTKESISDQSLYQTWSLYPQLKAVTSKNVHIIRDDFAEIPGPRFILLLERFASILQKTN